MYISIILLQNVAPWHSSSSFRDDFVSEAVDEASHQAELVDSDESDEVHDEDWNTVVERMNDDSESNEDEPISESNTTAQRICIPDQSAVSEAVPEPCASLWTGFKIVGDNVDKTLAVPFSV